MAAPLTFGTAFASAGFTVDPNFSPNNQQFANAVLAVCGRAGLPFGFEAANVVLAGPAAGVAALPAYRALVAADLPGGINGFANPTTKVGVAVVNGTATTAMRSDGAPQIDQAIAPAWSGIHQFQGTGAQVVLGTSTSYAWGTGTQYPIQQFAGVGSIYGTATTGIVLTGGGLYFNGTKFIYGQAGTGAIVSLGTGSFTVSCVNTSGTAAGTATPTVVFSIGGTVTSNKIQGYGPVAAALVDMTPDTGTFNGTLASVTTVITCPCVWARSGNVVVLAIGTGTGTSNANDFTLGGLPAAITPTRTQRLEVPDYAVENSGAVGSITTDVELVMNTNGTMTFLNGGTAANWGATLFKGVAAMFTVPYLLN